MRLSQSTAAGPQPGHVLVNAFMDDACHRLRVALHPSPTLVLALGGAYTGGAVCLMSLDMGWGIKSLMLAFLILSGFCDLHTHAAPDRRFRVKEIILQTNGEWTLVNGGGETLRGRPAADYLLHPLAVCVSVRLGGGRHVSVLVLGDMCTDDAFRQLRAWLSVYGAGGQDAVDGQQSLL